MVLHVSPHCSIGPCEWNKDQCINVWCSIQKNLVCDQRCMVCLVIIHNVGIKWIKSKRLNRNRVFTNIHPALSMPVVSILWSMFVPFLLSDLITSEPARIQTRDANNRGWTWKSENLWDFSVVPCEGIENRGEKKFWKEAELQRKSF